MRQNSQSKSIATLDDIAYYVFQDFKWIEADESQMKINECKLVPLKSLSSPVLEVNQRNLF